MKKGPPPPSPNFFSLTSEIWDAKALIPTLIVENFGALCATELKEDRCGEVT